MLYSVASAAGKHVVLEPGQAAMRRALVPHTRGALRSASHDLGEARQVIAVAMVLNLMYELLQPSTRGLSPFMQGLDLEPCCCGALLLCTCAVASSCG